MATASNVRELWLVPSQLAYKRAHARASYHGICLSWSNTPRRPERFRELHREGDIVCVVGNLAGLDRSSGEEKRKMAGSGVLEVHLVDAKGLTGNDFLGEIGASYLDPRPSAVRRRRGRSSSISSAFLSCAGKIDPYVVVQYRSQERKSSVARGQLILLRADYCKLLGFSFQNSDYC